MDALSYIAKAGGINTASAYPYTSGSTQTVTLQYRFSYNIPVPQLTLDTFLFRVCSSGWYLQI